MYNEFIGVCKKELKSGDTRIPTQFILHKGKEYLCRDKILYIEISVDDDVYGSCNYMFHLEEYDEYFYSVKELRVEKLLKICRLS